MPYARKSTIGGYKVIITESRSPLAKVIEEIPCTSEADMQKTFNRIMKELGHSYGGFR